MVYDEDIMCIKEMNVLNKGRTACLTGNLELVQYLFEFMKAICERDLLFDVIFNNDFDILKYLHQNLSELHLIQQINYLKENVLVFLHEIMGLPCSYAGMNFAVANGKLEILEYLHKGCGLELFKDGFEECFSDNFVTLAIEKSDIDVLKFLLYETKTKFNVNEEQLRKLLKNI
eukprot:Pgem_evm1s5701